MTFFNDHDKLARRQAEIEFWRDSEHESPESDSIHNFVNKMSDAAVFLDCIQRFEAKVAGSRTVLELGGGQGRASCIYKRLFPEAEVTVTDISEYAVASLQKWERALNVQLNSAYACASDATRETDQSVDLVFCFASAHHFLSHRPCRRSNES